jgi:glutaredoxin-like protein NrdH
MAEGLTHVKGKNAGAVMLFALSTCGWCRMTRDLLNSLQVAYDFIYMDLAEGKEYEAMADKLERLNPSGSYPTVVIGKKVIVGFKEDDIRKALKK